MSEYSIVVAISGRGSNLQSLIAKQGSYRIIGVVADTEALGLQFAKEAGIPTYSFPRRKFETLNDQKDAIYDCIISQNPDAVALAGFMQIIRADFLAHFSQAKKPVLNIHPSLLPAFPGLHTHERAIEAQVSEHGCTVHLVDSGVDTGSRIAQARVPVLPTDTAESLQVKVLEREHLIYPWVLEKIARKQITFSDIKPTYTPKAESEAKKMNFSVGEL